MKCRECEHRTADSNLGDLCRECFDYIIDCITELSIIATERIMEDNYRDQQTLR